MSKQQLLVFDLDDTLLDTSEVYWQARSAFVKKLMKDGMNEEQIIEEFEKIDSINIKKFGFDPTRYEKSMFATYKLIYENSSHYLSDETLSYIKSCGRLILEKFPQPINGAINLLQWASKQYRLAVLTRGDDSFQRLKLKNSGMARYFDFVRVVPKKDASVFSEFIEDIGYNSRNTWIIGDSIKSDINPGIEAGATCIFYVYKHPHYYWLQDYECHTLGSFYKIYNLYEVRKILESPLSFEMVTEV